MAAQAIRYAFRNDTNLAERVANAWLRCQNDPELSQIFVDIATFVEQSTEEKEVSATQDITISHSQSKKRKLDTNGDAQQPDDLADSSPVFECRDVSFTIPSRKKLKLELRVSSSQQEQGQIRLIDTKADSVEYTLNLADIGQSFCLPVPDKTTRQKNYVIIPKDNNAEQIVFTLNEAVDKSGTVGRRSTAANENETLTDTTLQELRAFLARQGKKVIQPDDREFASSIPQAHRKGEKAYHVKAFRGSKEGYLFFLSNGIFFGFKKPLLFFAFGDIESISYTSVLQRTFNLVITPLEDKESTQDIEFSMLDQADFAGIDEYIKAHGLNDASMAADRRAKMYNVNKETKAEETNGTAAGIEPDDGQTELQKAEQQLQDEEDELEEDYDPSGGESDGEGEESEEGDTYDNDEGYDDAEDDAEGEEAVALDDEQC